MMTLLAFRRPRATASNKRPRDDACVECGDEMTLSDLRMPTAAELPQFIASLVRHHGARAVVTELLKVCSAEDMQDACDRAWGVRSDDPDEQSARVRRPSHASSLGPCAHDPD